MRGNFYIILFFSTLALWTNLSATPSTLQAHEDLVMLHSNCTSRLAALNGLPGIQHVLELARSTHPSRDEFWDGHKRFLDAEKKSDWMFSRQYQDIITLVISGLQPEEKESLLYPYAGLDFYWSDYFKKSVFIDPSYGNSAPATSFWKRSHYRWASIDLWLRQLESARLVSPNRSIILSGSSTLVDRHLLSDQLPPTLLLKGQTNLDSEILSLIERLKIKTVIVIDSFAHLGRSTSLLELGFVSQSFVKGSQEWAPFGTPILEARVYRKLND